MFLLRNIKKAFSDSLPKLNKIDGSNPVVIKNKSPSVFSDYLNETSDREAKVEKKELLDPYNSRGTIAPNLVRLSTEIEKALEYNGFIRGNFISGNFADLHVLIDKESCKPTSLVAKAIAVGETKISLLYGLDIDSDPIAKI
eukprot:snap_masked-scaffold_29-processed-gene-2.35-mRNA-1 protein AED:1.00 eAED:1.00 QI:0/-1/0/0/-1/1/1/0/141